MSEDFFSN